MEEYIKVIEDGAEVMIRNPAFKKESIREEVERLEAMGWNGGIDKGV